MKQLLLVCAAACALMSGCGDDAQTITPFTTGGGSDGTTDGGDGGNHAPTLNRIGDKTIGIGTTLVIEPRASDIDGDVLTYSIYGTPDGGTWSGQPPRLAWTPEQFEKPVSVTFRVSDGEESDLEKILITVSDAVSNHAPTFYPFPDQFPEVGQPYFVQLQATDLDGDTLTFDVQGPVPQDAVLNAAEGTFGWTPGPAEEGKEFALRFGVSDATERVEMTVRYFVLGAGQNKPPSFEPVPPQVAPVSEPWSLQVNAIDPDGDPLTYSLKGSGPAGSAFNPVTRTLSWTPAPQQIGTHVFELTVTDASWSIPFNVPVQVPEVTPGQCTDDVNEPNNGYDAATPITTGSYEKLSICDTEDNPVDSDWFSISLVAGQTLSVELVFSQAIGDLDVAIYNPNAPTVPVAEADSVTDNEGISYTVPASGVYVVKVFGTGQALFESHYEMTVSTAGLNCQEDGNEPNNGFTSATPLLPGDLVSGGQLCPNNKDFYTLDVQCGSTLTAQLTFEHAAGNLDVHLYREASLDEPAVSATGQANTETLVFSDAPLNETVYLLVTGDPPESTTNGYSLSTSVSGGPGCSDDAFEPNDIKTQATQLQGPSSELEGLKACCSVDWFFLPLQQGEGFLAVIKTNGVDGYTAKIIDGDGETVLAEGEADSEGVIVVLEAAPFAGNHYIVVEGPPGTTYGIDVEVIVNSSCGSTKACPGNEICKLTSGSCITDVCSTAVDCPTGQEMPCKDFHCLAGCTYDADCKLGHACKGFSFGKYCGEFGGKPVGSPCSLFAACDGASSCFFEDKGGFCTNIGCQSNADCTGTADCVEWQNTTLCAPECDDNGDCRTDEGYSCQPKTLVNGIPTNVCLPVP